MYCKWQLKAQGHILVQQTELTRIWHGDLNCHLHESSLIRLYLEVDVLLFSIGSLGEIGCFRNNAVFGRTG